MAKKAKKRAPRELTRKQLSRIERDRRAERWLVLGTTIVGVVVVGVLVYGFLVERVFKAREAVAVVGDTRIATAEFQARVRFSRLQMQNELLFWREQQQSLDPTDPDSEAYLNYIQESIRSLESQLAPGNSLSVGEQAFEQLIQEELVRQEAQRTGITITPEELQQEIERFFGYERNPATPTPEPADPFPLIPTEVLTPDLDSSVVATAEPTPTPMTEEGFRQQYEAYMKSLKEQGITETQYRSWVEVSLLAARLLDEFKAEIPATADQVKVGYLVVDSASGQEKADDLAARLDGGEDFQALADELEADEAGAGYGNELDWLPQSALERRLDPELAELAFSLGVGERSQPVLSEDGSRYTIIVVMGHEERALSASLRDSLGEDAFQEWLDVQQVRVERRTYQDRIPLEP